MSKNSNINISEIKRMFKLKLKDRYKLRGVSFSANCNSNKNYKNNSSNNQKSNKEKIHFRNKTILDLKISQLMQRYSSLKKIIRDYDKKEEEERKIKNGKKIKLKKGIHFTSYHYLFFEENKNNDSYINIINNLKNNEKVAEKTKKDFDILIEKIEKKRKKMKLFQKNGSLLSSDISKINQTKSTNNILINNNDVNKNPLNFFKPSYKEREIFSNYNSLSPIVTPRSISKSDKQLISTSKSKKNFKNFYRINSSKIIVEKHKPLYLLDVDDLLNKHSDVQIKCKNESIDDKTSRFQTNKTINKMLDVKKESSIFSLKEKNLESKFSKQKNQNVNNRKIFITRLKQNVRSFNNYLAFKVIEK